MHRGFAAILSLTLIAGCATGRAVRRGENAAKRADWDTAVAYYREALGRDPSRVDVKVALARTSQLASAEHMKRARELEAQEQYSGAAAEYRLAAELDATNSLAASKAAQLDQRVRQQIEATRPRPPMDVLKEQAAAQFVGPKLDPRSRLMALSFTNNRVRDILSYIGLQTGINITYDQGADTLAETKTYTLDANDISIEQALNQVLTANGLTYRIQDSKTVLIYQDDQQHRAKYEDIYQQVFYLSHADATELATLLGQIVGQTGGTGRYIGPNKSANSIVAKAPMPVLLSIADIINANDKPRAEILIEVEILEVDRKRIKQLGLDLSSFQLGFTFSPELTPANVAGSPLAFPTMPSPINVGTISQGVGRHDFYMTAPTAIVRFLESDSKTRVLAKPSLRGREGANALTVNIGEKIPVLTGTTQSANPNILPTSNITTQQTGVTLNITNLKVTYQDEIIMDLVVDKIGLGQFFELGQGQSSPSFTNRNVATTLRMRDGEASMLAGLIKDEERKVLTGVSGVSRIPWFGKLFGNQNNDIEQSDLVVIITPHIVRGHELTANDLKPIYVGTANQFGATSQPQLISPGAPPPVPAGPPGQTAGTTQPPSSTAPPPVPTPTPTPAPTSTRAPGVVPVVPISAADAPATPAQISVTGPSGAVQVGAGPYLVPITYSGTMPVGTVTLSLTYNPRVLRAMNVTQGPFMQQNAQTSFAPKIDDAAGRVDIAIARTGATAGATPGASNQIAAVVFSAIGAGTSPIAVSGVALTADGKAIPVNFVPGSVIVR